MIPKEILQLLFSEHIQKHINPETVKYANDSTFNMTEYHLRCFAVTLFLPGYHSLPQQHLYCNDVDSPMVYQCISNNKLQ